MSVSGLWPFRMTRRPSRMSGSCRKALPEVPDALPDFPVGCEALPDVRQLSVGPPGCPVVVKSPSRMSGSGREALPVVREW